MKYLISILFLLFSISIYADDGCDCLYLDLGLGSHFRAFGIHDAGLENPNGRVDFGYEMDNGLVFTYVHESNFERGFNYNAVYILKRFVIHNF